MEDCLFAMRPPFSRGSGLETRWPDPGELTEPRRTANYHCDERHRVIKTSSWTSTSSLVNGPNGRKILIHQSHSHSVQTKALWSCWKMGLPCGVVTAHPNAEANLTNKSWCGNNKSG